MTDRELLELAAKAAGMNIEWQPCGWAHDNNTGCEWNPITDDGDALRLAVKLNMLEEGSRPFVELMWRLATEVGSDDFEATRRAIVRAAAEIGRSMA